jgi:hypothetical protein
MIPQFVCHALLTGKQLASAAEQRITESPSLLSSFLRQQQPSLSRQGNCRSVGGNCPHICDEM